MDLVTIKSILGAIAVVISIFALVPYFRDIYRGKTKPHAFSWFIWGSFAAIIFVAQITQGGGSGAWVNLSVAILNLSIFVLALKCGEKHITLFDWVCLFAAAVAVGLWIITDDPTVAVIIVTCIDLLGALPTVRKIWNKPGEETVLTYALYFFAWICSIIALNNYTIVTILDPVALLLMNFLIVWIILSRRRALT